MRLKHDSGPFPSLLDSMKSLICSASEQVQHRLPAEAPESGPMFTSLLLSKIRTYLKYRETVRELSRLSDRELADVGISRFQIDGVARGFTAA